MSATTNSTEARNLIYRNWITPKSSIPEMVYVRGDSYNHWLIHSTDPKVPQSAFFEYYDSGFDRRHKEPDTRTSPEFLTYWAIKSPHHCAGTVLYELAANAQTPRTSFPKKRFRTIQRQISCLETVPELAPATSTSQLDDGPKARAERLLASLEEDVLNGKPPHQERCKNLGRLATQSEGRQYLLDNFERSSPKIQWLLMEFLAKSDWLPLSAILFKKLDTWDIATDRPAILGTLIAVRHYRVPDSHRKTLTNYLEKLISSSQKSARDGSYPEFTELLVQSITTFSSFASENSLKIVYPLSSNGASFNVALAALQFLTRLACRYPDKPEISEFFKSETPNIIQKIKLFHDSRMIAIENGTLLWAYYSLLMARCGAEIEEVRDLASNAPSLSIKILGLLNQSWMNVRRIANDDWIRLNESRVAELTQFLKSINTI
ncbi:MAG: hypothetical protein V4689_20570 [Verrucomicrobiota bacterium]